MTDADALLMAHPHYAHYRATGCVPAVYLDLDLSPTDRAVLATLPDVPTPFGTLAREWRTRGVTAKGLRTTLQRLRKRTLVVGHRADHWSTQAG